MARSWPHQRSSTVKSTCEPRTTCTPSDVEGCPHPLHSITEGIGTRSAIHAFLLPLRGFRAIVGRTLYVTRSFITVGACAKWVEKFRPPPHRFSKFSDRLSISPQLGERDPTGIIGLTHLR